MSTGRHGRQSRRPPALLTGFTDRRATAEWRRCQGYSPTPDTGRTALDAALAAVLDLATIAFEEPERALLNARVIPSVPALAGRDLVRQRQIVDAISEALAASGVAPLDARLAAETALGVWRVAVTGWVLDPRARPLPDVVAEAAAAVRSLSATGPASVAAP